MRPWEVIFRMGTALVLVSSIIVWVCSTPFLPNLVNPTSRRALRRSLTPPDVAQLLRASFKE